MQYALLIYSDPSAAPKTEEEGNALYAEFMAFTNDIRSSGAFVSGEPLAMPTSATTVRVRDGKVAVSDGPFAETKEWLGGIYVIEAPSLDDALEVAKKCPGSKYGSVEIRPIAEM
ncbi:MAG TPA: YciI family protein [Candidatus Baltobacteraceae bacterium]